jgi:ribose 1,5-bisphosphokinase PhnN
MHWFSASTGGMLINGSRGTLPFAQNLYYSVISLSILITSNFINLLAIHRDRSRQQLHTRVNAGGV